MRYLDSNLQWSEVSVRPDPPGPHVPTNREVRWAIYEDGTLVINGQNEPDHNGHGCVVTSCDTCEWVDAQDRWVQYSLLDLDSEYSHILDGNSVPWRGAGDVLPNHIDDIVRVEFAADTSPAHMDGWFTGSSRIVSIDSTGLDLSRCESMRGMFAYYSASSEGNAIGNIVPSLADWDVSHVEDLSFAFADMNGEDYPFGRALIDLRGWMPAAGFNANEMFRGCSSLKVILCQNTWDCDDSDMFRDCGNILNFDNFISFDPSSVGSDMANPVNGYFTSGDFGPLSVPDMEEFGILDAYPFFPMAAAYLIRDLDQMFAMSPAMVSLVARQIAMFSIPYSVRDDYESFIASFEDAKSAMGDDPESIRNAVQSLIETIAEPLYDLNLECELVDVVMGEFLTRIDLRLLGSDDKEFSAFVRPSPAS